MPSSYFSKPSDHLDPALFNGTHLISDLRLPLVKAAIAELENAGLNSPASWLYMWLTGSAISYQWAADRGNGDLDVQLGVDYDSFLHHNPAYHSIDPYMMSDMINRLLRENLWPKMSSAILNGKTFEVTYFWNTMASSDISMIHPYAAYDLLKDEWVVQPPHVSEDPRAAFPDSWYEMTGHDTNGAQALSQGHAAALQALQSAVTGSAEHINARTQLNLIHARATAMFSDIHEGRRQAFSMGGKGYWDYHNFRWQVAKDRGTVDTLYTLIHQMDSDLINNDTELYGGPIKSAPEALEEAMTFRMGKRYGG